MRSQLTTPEPRPVTFSSEGETLVGTLFLPDSADPATPLPVIIVGGPWTQVKEQVGYRYGRALAARGLAALAFDHRGWGESGGEPRSLESTRRKVQDLKAAVDWLRGVPEVDDGRIGMFGVCAAAGNMALMIAEDDRVRSFATTAAWLQHPETTPLFYGGAEGVAQRVALAEAARDRFEQTGGVEYVKAYDPSDGSGAAMFFPLDYYGNPDRGALPEWRNEFAVMGWKEWLELDAIAPAADIRIPVLMVHSDGSALPQNVRLFFDRLAGPKDLFWTEGEHTEFYDQDANVARVVDAAVAHFTRTLGPSARG